jgi:homospermidine synthase
MSTATPSGAGRKKLVLIGCGAVGCAVLELLPLSAIVPAADWARILIIEPRELSREMAALRPRLREVEHWRIALTRGNLESTLDRALGRGDTVVDASVNVDALAVMAFCSARRCVYVNTSMENWEVPHPERLEPGPGALYARSLYARVLEAKQRFPPGGPSMLADHGMNPGLISHFAQKGLEDVAKKLGDSAALALLRGGGPDPAQGVAKAAERLGLRVLHIAEKDTQLPKRARPSGHFYNTWSAVGLVAEALDPVQLGFGAHEDASATVAPNADTQGAKRPGSHYVAPARGPKNVRFLPIRGMDLRLTSFSPGRHGRGSKITGYAIPHGESNTLSALLTRGAQPAGRGAQAAAYRPSVYYVYQVAACARASLERMRKGGHSPDTMPVKHVLRLPEIRKGYDAVGALLLFDETPANPRGRGIREWWCGSILSTEDVKRSGFVPSGPTVVQVAIAIVSALRWLLANPSRGFLTPEDLPFADVLRDAVPFLGRIFSGPVASGLGRRRQFSDFVVRGRSGRRRNSGPSTRRRPPATKPPRTRTGSRASRPSRAKSSGRRRNPKPRTKRRNAAR